MATLISIIEKEHQVMCEKPSGWRWPRRLGNQCFKVQDGKLVLKENHNYFYQVQMQMFITKLPFCDFFNFIQRKVLLFKGLIEIVVFRKKWPEICHYFMEQFLLPNILKLGFHRIFQFSFYKLSAF